MPQFGFCGILKNLMSELVWLQGDFIRVRQRGEEICHEINWYGIKLTNNLFLGGDPKKLLLCSIIALFF